MRVAAPVWLLLVLLAASQLPETRSRKITEEAAADKVADTQEETGFGFLTSTLAPLSEFLFGSSSDKEEDENENDTAPAVIESEDDADAPGAKSERNLSAVVTLVGSEAEPGQNAEGEQQRQQEEAATEVEGGEEEEEERKAAGDPGQTEDAAVNANEYAVPAAAAGVAPASLEGEERSPAANEEEVMPNDAPRNEADPSASPTEDEEEEEEEETSENDEDEEEETADEDEDEPSEDEEEDEEEERANEEKKNKKRRKGKKGKRNRKKKLNKKDNEIPQDLTEKMLALAGDDSVDALNSLMADRIARMQELEAEKHRVMDVNVTHPTNLSYDVMVSDVAFYPGMPDVNKLQKHLRNCPNCLVKTTHSPCPLNDIAMELRKWMRGIHELLVFGCEMGEKCQDNTKCCYSRDPTLSQSIQDMSDMARKVFDILQASCNNCPRDGGWTPWEPWTPCPVTCGGGTRSRTRSCTNPVPSPGGKKCPGRDRETDRCSPNSCCDPQHGNWSPWMMWTPCKVTCGPGGMQERQRTCTNPPPNRCGRTCPGPNSDMQPCRQNPPCCVPMNGNWGFWAPWSACSVSCGDGTKTRSRQCNNPAPNECGGTCPGPAKVQLGCNTGQNCCVPRNGNWGFWAPWSACSVSCGDGTKTRSRQCNNPAPNECGGTCPGPANVQLGCNTGQNCCVPRHGNWGFWAPWSGCSSSCGPGTKSRSRRCNNPGPNQCGQTCPGNPMEQLGCDSGPCCNAQWGQWQSWEQCQSSCGPGIRLRRRQCQNFGRSGFSSAMGMRQCPPCPGRDSDTSPCDNGPCQPPCVHGSWGQWQPWGGCSVSCGQGTETRIRRCDSPSPNFCGQRCPGVPSQDKQCMRMNCCVPRNGNWAFWSQWSRCSASCGPGMRTRSRACSNPPPNECGGQCPGAPGESVPCDGGPCCVNGNWGQWQQWSPCPVTCQTGTISRRRRCNNPPPNSCGRQCPGVDRDTSTCNRGECPYVCVDGSWADWGRWSRCTVTCGVGARHRTRTCSNPRPDHCGRECSGPRRQKGVCNKKPCCVPRHGNWGYWASWSGCSASCGPGVTTRSRMCTNPQPNECGRRCPGSPSDTSPCNGGSCCVPRNGNWAYWSQWSSCSASCGPGIRTRSRSCSNPQPNECGQTCPGNPTEQIRCDGGSCCVPQHGNWGFWAPWSGCSASCGPGMRTRSRSCSNPPPNECGRRCPGSPSDSTRCDGGSCCVPQNGNWGFWGQWSGCSASCGPGMRTRSRSCSNPPPNECGRRCPGSPSDSTRCDGGSCCVPQNGNWGFWGQWSGCSASCGPGMRTRSRSCSNPPPNQCGRRCPGTPSDSTPCDGGSCCVPQNGNWGFWSPWSGCSASCGPGMRTRSRSCSNPPPNECGRRCPGTPSDSTRCDGGSCCVPQHGNWGFWGQWSGCSASCGPGMRTRSRSCSNPQPNECGRRCPGSPSDSTRCDGGSCCVPQNGNWGFWSPWSGCSASCGPGMRTRSRSCSNPPPNQCGRTCPGSPSDSTRCDGGSCCVPQHGNWGFWGQWSGCSASCGPGMRTRSRSCSNPQPNECGRRCPGSPSDSTRCDGGSCCVPQHGNWGFWSPWSGCSASCGPGMRTRSRSCSNPQPNECGRRCPGSPSDSTRCDGGSCCVPQNGNWGFWSPWSGCSASCGPGMRTRSRSCSNPQPNECGRMCPGSPSDSTSCDGGSCCVPQNGNWGFWAPWSRCSSSCGSGMKTRSRQCSNPPPNECGRTCPGMPSERNSCDSGPCCVNGNWGPWGPWGVSSVTCGSGMRSRRRTCDNPRPNFCGSTCPGSETDTELYNTGVPCVVCVDGNWGNWGPWGACPVSCGMGVRERRRNCDSPSPNRCGQTCSGTGFETALQRCGPDPSEEQWNQWGPWTPCDVTCGNGRRSRERSCAGQSNYGFGAVSYFPSGCSTPCRGETSQVNSCQMGPCRPPPEWGQWESWCPCSCNSGRRSRRRNCEEVVNYGSGTVVDISLCGSAPAREEEYCDVRQHCPVCTSDCQGKRDGEYPSCTSCNDYIRCRSGNVELVSCRASGYTYDAFIRKCTTPPSPSCSLVKCVSSCGNQADGRYPSCFGCSSYMDCRMGQERREECPPGQEFNAHNGQCDSGRSPTCERAIVRSIGFMQRDAPEENYFRPHQFNEDDRLKLYRQMKHQVGVAKQFDREMQADSPLERTEEENLRLEEQEEAMREKEEREKKEKMERLAKERPQGDAPTQDLEEEEEVQLEKEREDLEQKGEELVRKATELEREKEELESWLEEELNQAPGDGDGDDDDNDNDEDDDEEEGEEERPGSTVVVEGTKDEEAADFKCQTDCSQLEPGSYQSCEGCHQYLVCDDEGNAKIFPCAKNKVWDDIKKKCRRSSRTCKQPEE